MFGFVYRCTITLKESVTIALLFIGGLCLVGVCCFALLHRVSCIDGRGKNYILLFALGLLPLLDHRSYIVTAPVLLTEKIALVHNEA